ncbi:hypothetical protein HN587_05420 [Candidatus Woesearchaeota archaeon]|jgi:NOL1/NOP2/fmu family ribosome biogenesis protein|nr:hypothetical protein [Candidatus Woesearchaeota archaeon]
MNIKKKQGSYHILNSKEKKNVINLINSQWGCNVNFDNLSFKTNLTKLNDSVLEQNNLSEEECFGEVALIINSKNKLFLISRGFDVLSDEMSFFRLEKMGLYFATLDRNEIRLSMEGSQIIGSIATKNILELSEAQVKEWILGFDLSFDDLSEDAISNYSGYVIVKYKTDFLCVGKFSNKDKKSFLNFVPKSRRIKIIS